MDKRSPSRERRSESPTQDSATSATLDLERATLDGENGEENLTEEEDRFFHSDKDLHGGGDGDGQAVGMDITEHPEPVFPMEDVDHHYQRFDDNTATSMNDQVDDKLKEINDVASNQGRQAMSMPVPADFVSFNFVGHDDRSMSEHPQNAGPRGRSHANRQRRASPPTAGNAKSMSEEKERGSSSNEKRSTCSQPIKVTNSGAASSFSFVYVPPTSNPSQSQSQNPSLNENTYFNWQASRPTVKERLQYLFNNEIMADVHFAVGRGQNLQRIPAHTFVLSIGSAVFDAMFNGGMATAQDEIEIPDVEASAFLSLLRFLYTDEVQIGPETVMTTLYAAKKYAVPALERECVEFLKKNLCSDNAFMLLTQARLFDEPQLAALCLETIDKNTNEALSAEGFTDIDLDTLCVVLERDTLGIRECKLFSAVCRWSSAEALRQNHLVNPENKRAALGRALTFIRFPLMTVEEFAVGAAQTGILSDREVVDLFLHFTVNPKPSVGFLDTPRCCLTGKEQVVARFCQIESRWGYSGTSDRVRFMVNRRIFVVGFGLYGSIHGPSEYGVNIQIIHTDTGKVCGQNDTSFQCDGSTSTFRVMFKEPVEIQPNTNYTACATLKGPDSHYGTKGLRKVTHESLTAGKVTFHFTYAAGNNNGTSVEDGQLPEIIFYT